ncbi:helix-turn-helix domain-containing protein [Priestia megaterium]|uniref:helix-turn-helix domain-containing protein n=1 Tax=Priestia megaterium TaxID=1404 RepID=UPI001BEB0C3A|nr:helix-turn-helix transcriptional regulator [Priestia megaterium]MBT2255930.1 helix-turn-helix transcriptional regulator [Priestia megaterium]
MEWFALGKKRSKLGKWIDRRGISQTTLVDKTKLSKGTVSRVCSDKDYLPSSTTATKILRFLKKLDSTVTYEDFWM